MKRFIYCIGICCGLYMATSCEEDLPVYDTDVCRLNFILPNSSSERKEISYSFVYHGDVENDTVWLEMSTMGFVSDKERALELRQVATEGDDAEPGVHYVAFDDADLKRFYVVPAGAVETRVPVVLLRDGSLKKKTVVLRVAVKENEYFKAGYESFSYREILFTDKLSKPDNWEAYYLDYAFGPYRPGKHQFMIDATGNAWDEAYIEEFMNGDSGYQTYMAAWLPQELERVNAERTSQGLDILREDTDEDGDGVLDPVVFDPPSWWD